MEHAWKTRSEKDEEYEEILTDLELSVVGDCIPLFVTYTFEQAVDALDKIGWGVHPKWDKGPHDFNAIEEYLFKHDYQIIPKGG